MTSHNNAGSTVKEYTFETLRFNGYVSELDHDGGVTEVSPLFRDVHLMVVVVFSVFGTMLVLIGACLCIKNSKNLQIFVKRKEIP